MFSYIKGEIVEVRDNQIVLENNGMGYEIFVSGYALKSFSEVINTEVKVYTYFQVKEIEVDNDNPYFKSINNEYILSKDGKELYWAKNALAEVNIPDTVEVIKSHTFYYSKTQEIRLPNKVKKIEANIVSFSSVRKIEIPSSIQEISIIAFSEANDLEEVVIHKKKDSIAGSPWGNLYGDRAIIWDN